MPYPLRLLLVDDSEPFLAALTASLVDIPQLVIVGTARSAREALTQVIRLQPHVVVMDIALPGVNGLEATRHIKAQPQAPSVVILTMYDNAEYRAAAATAGAEGFVNKVGCDDTLPALLVQLRLAASTQVPTLSRAAEEPSESRRETISTLMRRGDRPC